MEGIITLDKYHDLMYSPDQDEYYIQEYKMDGSGTARTSKLYSTPNIARREFVGNRLTYGKWG